MTDRNLYLQEAASKIRSILVEIPLWVKSQADEIIVGLRIEDVPETIRRLRDHKALQVRQLLDMTAVDYPSKRERFEIVYILLSLQKNLRVRLHASVEDGAKVASITHLFLAANWYEREMWDMFGIEFVGHPDLRRILTDYDFEGHPLRKDFPLTGFQEVHFSEQEQAVIYDKISLPLAYRDFDFLSPWSGVLPGDEKVQLNEDQR